MQAVDVLSSTGAVAILDKLVTLIGSEEEALAIIDECDCFPMDPGLMSVFHAYRGMATEPHPNISSLPQPASRSTVSAPTASLNSASPGASNSNVDPLSQPIASSSTFLSSTPSDLYATVRPTVPWLIDTLLSLRVPCTSDGATGEESEMNESRLCAESRARLFIESLSAAQCIFVLRMWLLAFTASDASVIVSFRRVGSGQREGDARIEDQQVMNNVDLNGPEYESVSGEVEGNGNRGFDRMAGPTAETIAMGNEDLNRNTVLTVNGSSLYPPLAPDPVTPVSARPVILPSSGRVVSWVTTSHQLQTQDRCGEIATCLYMELPTEEEGVYQDETPNVTSRSGSPPDPNPPPLIQQSQQRHCQRQLIASFQVAYSVKVIDIGPKPSYKIREKFRKDKERCERAMRKLKEASGQALSEEV
eukprot:gene6502-8304_t